jgi:hypothetical protein
VLDLAGRVRDGPVDPAAVGLGGAAGVCGLFGG